MLPLVLTGNEQCKYSHFQLLKLQNNTYDRISAYCPVDLFSGSKKRMQKAIKALISDPQNNFRVFRSVVFEYQAFFVKLRHVVLKYLLK